MKQLKGNTIDLYQAYKLKPSSMNHTRQEQQVRHALSKNK